MDISDALKLKSELEIDIQNKLVDFENSTKLCIEDLNLLIYRYMGCDSGIVGVNIKISL